MNSVPAGRSMYLSKVQKDRRCPMPEIEEIEQNAKPEGMSFITKLILGKLVLIAVVGIAVYFSLQSI